MEMNNRVMGAALFLVGLVIGVNYPKIKKQVQPLLKKIGEKSSDAYVAVNKFVATQKERAEDLFAKAKMTKAQQTNTGKGIAKKVKTAKAAA